MNLLILLLVIITIYGARVSSDGHSDYIGRNQTDSIKGIFAIIILFSHMRGYLPPPGENDIVFYSTLVFIDQLMVVMFLLYSGYGVMESLKRNRQKYYDTFLTHRLLKTWLMFAIAVGLYFILALVLGHEYPAKNYIWCWIGWESIGNSNWFVFDILVLYLITYSGLFVANRMRLSLKKCTIIVLVLTFIFDIFLKSSGKDAYWYDTIIAYPVGMLFSLYKPQIEKRARGYRWIMLFLVFAGLFLACRYVSMSDLLKANGATRMVNHLMYISTSSFFAIALVFLTMKLKLDNAALRWLGVNAFAIYILQRLTMILCAEAGLNKHSLVFAAIVIPSTLLIAAIFTASTNRMNAILFKK